MNKIIYLVETKEDGHSVDALFFNNIECAHYYAMEQLKTLGYRTQVIIQPVFEGPDES